MIKEALKEVKGLDSVKAKALFEQYDINSDGKIDLKELKRLSEGLLDREVSNDEVTRAVCISFFF